MSLSFFQLLVILFLGILLFGDIPSLLKKGKRILRLFETTKRKRS